MEIERINEHTIKLYISYLDIEERGFEREEIWYDRERSEQLFWQMIEEVHDQEDDFIFEGPLWIQVQALEKGIEVIVTKSQFLKDEGIHLPMLEDRSLENLLKKNLSNAKYDDSDHQEEELLVIVKFKDFEDVIQLSYHFQNFNENYPNKLYFYRDQYYLTIELPWDESDEKLDDYMSLILEFAVETDMSIHILEEYGKEIFPAYAITKIKKYFSQ